MRRAGPARSCDLLTRETLLTKRGIEVLELIEAGWTTKRIAHHLGIAERTARWHLEQIYRDLDAQNRAEAVARAYRLGLLGATRERAADRLDVARREANEAAQGIVPPERRR